MYISQFKKIILVNQNRNEIPPRIRIASINQSISKIITVGENAEKKECLYTGGNVNWCNYDGKQYGGLSEN